MATIDSAGAASSALYAQPVQVQTTPQTANLSQRAVVESSETKQTTDTVTQASNNNDTKLGRFVDTTA